MKIKYCIVKVPDNRTTADDNDSTSSEISQTRLRKTCTLYAFKQFFTNVDLLFELSLNLFFTIKTLK